MSYSLRPAKYSGRIYSPQTFMLFKIGQLLLLRLQLDTSTTPLHMIHVSTVYKTMRFMSMGNTSMRYTSTGNGMVGL
jgi:hypothetical protein